MVQVSLCYAHLHTGANLWLSHQAIQWKYYTGPSKLNPPLLQTKALPAEESQLQSTAVKFSQQRDAAWLSQVHESDKPVDWADFNAQEDPLVVGSGQKPKTLVVFGPMTNSLPAHPDTVLTVSILLGCSTPISLMTLFTRREGLKSRHSSLSRPPTVSDFMPSPM